MKKTVKTLGIIFLSLIPFCWSCSGSNKSADSQSEEVGDQTDYAQLYEDALTFEAGEISMKNVPETEYNNYTQPITIKNNSIIALTPEDYIITYEYEHDDWDVDGIITVTSQDSIKGIEIAPNSTLVAIINKDGLGLKNTSVKLKISQEEFEKRYKEAAK